MENPHNGKKKNWNKKYMTSMKYQAFERKHFDISSLGDEELYIIGYNYSKDEGFIPNTNEIKNKYKFGEKPILEIINDVYNRDFMKIKVDDIHKGWSILDSLISLRQKLTYPYNINEDGISNSQLLELEKNISKEDKNEIIKWCKIYGLPFLGKEIINNDMTLGIPPFKYGFKNDILTCHIKNYSICRLGSFLIALNIIFKTFIYYLEYIYHNNNYNLLDELDFTKEFLNINDIDSYIRRGLLSISSKAIIDVTNIDKIEEKEELPRFETYAETLISLAMYQLAIVLSSKKICSVKKCSFSECNHIFIPTRKSRTYCMNCSRQKAYNFKYNQKKD